MVLSGLAVGQLELHHIAVFQDLSILIQDLHAIGAVAGVGGIIVVISLRRFAVRIKMGPVIVMYVQILLLSPLRPGRIQGFNPDLNIFTVFHIPVAESDLRGCQSSGHLSGRFANGGLVILRIIRAGLNVTADRRLHRVCGIRHTLARLQPLKLHRQFRHISGLFLRLGLAALYEAALFDEGTVLFRHDGVFLRLAVTWSFRDGRGGRSGIPGCYIGSGILRHRHLGSFSVFLCPHSGRQAGKGNSQADQPAQQPPGRHTF